MSTDDDKPSIREIRNFLTLAVVEDAHYFRHPNYPADLRKRAKRLCVRYTPRQWRKDASWEEETSHRVAFQRALASLEADGILTIERGGNGQALFVTLTPTGFAHAAEYAREWSALKDDADFLAYLDKAATLKQAAKRKPASRKPAKR